VREDRVEQPANAFIREYRSDKQEIPPAALANVLQSSPYGMGLEIQQPPGAGRLAQGPAIVNLAGIHTDEISGHGCNASLIAPGGVSAGIDDADAELIMCVPREMPGGRSGHRIDTREREVVKTNVVARRAIP